MAQPETENTSAAVEEEKNAFEQGFFEGYRHAKPQDQVYGGTDYHRAEKERWEAYKGSARHAALLAKRPAAEDQVREALRALLAWAEPLEDKLLVGDEGCIWPVENARIVIAALGAAK